MQIFLASANVDEIKQAYLLPISGVLTNSTILEKEKVPFTTLVKEIDAIGNLQFGLQVVSTEEYQMMQEIMLFRQILLNRTLHLKIPFCHDAFKVINRVKNTGVLLNLTAISTLPQAVMALESQVDYISIYVGRVTDSGGDGLRLIEEVKQYAIREGKNAKVIAASIRNVEQLIEIIKIGADGVAIPFSLLVALLENKTTQNSINEFKKSWINIKEKQINDF